MRSGRRLQSIPNRRVTSSALLHPSAAALVYPVACARQTSYVRFWWRWSMRTGNSSSAKRIQKELAEISLDPPCNCSAGPKGDNIYEWVSTIMGPSGERCDVVRDSLHHWSALPSP